MGRIELTVNTKSLLEIVDYIKDYNYKYGTDYDIIHAIDYDENGKLLTVSCHNFHEFGRIDVLRLKPIEEKQHA